jgi:hypothetical protein
VRLERGDGGSQEHWSAPAWETPERSFKVRRHLGSPEFRRGRRVESVTGVPGDESLTKVGERSGEPGVPDFKVLIGDEARGAIAEYTADQLDSKIFDTLFNLWETSGESNPVRIADAVEALDRNVHIIALKDPSDVLLTSIGVPGASFWGSIIQEAPIGIIDKPLGSIERLVEFGGIIFGVMHGNLAMAFTCFKALVHDEVHRLSAAAIESLMNGDHSDSRQGNKSILSRDDVTHNADLVTHSLEENTAAAENARAVRRPVLQDFSPRATRERAAREQAAREQAAQERFMQDFLLRATRERAAREQAAREQAAREQAAQERFMQDLLLRATRERAAREQAAQERPDRERTKREIAEVPRDRHSMVSDAGAVTRNPIGRQGSMVQAGSVASASAGAPSGNAGSGDGGRIANRGKDRLRAGLRSLKMFEFVRLRIYYDSSYPGVCVNGVARTVNLMQLIVVRESYPFFLRLDRPEIATGVRVSSSGGKRDALNKTSQIWKATDERGFGWKASSVIALQSNLRRMLLGRPLDLTDGSLVVQDIPIGPVDSYLDPAMGWIEVVGIIDRYISAGPKVACMGFKAPAFDDFCRIVVRAIEESIVADRV